MRKTSCAYMLHIFYKKGGSEAEAESITHLANKQRSSKESVL